MRKRRQKGRCVKVSLNKNKEVCKCFDKIQEAFARMLAADDSVDEFNMNISLDFSKASLSSDLPAPEEPHTSDFLIKWSDGTLAVRECVFRHVLARQSIAEKLQLSKTYWEQNGITDWGIVIDKED